MQKMYKFLGLLMILSFALAACAPTTVVEAPAAEAPAAEAPAAEAPAAEAPAAEAPAAPPAPSNEEVLLSEIRDLLKQQNNS